MIVALGNALTSVEKESPLYKAVIDCISDFKRFGKPQKQRLIWLENVPCPPAIYPPLEEKCRLLTSKQILLKYEHLFCTPQLLIKKNALFFFICYVSLLNKSSTTPLLVYIVSTIKYLECDIRSQCT
jgi:hypothetical protein